jgi:hypothetical protein
MSLLPLTEQSRATLLNKLKEAGWSAHKRLGSTTVAAGAPLTDSSIFSTSTLASNVSVVVYVTWNHGQ